MFDSKVKLRGVEWTRRVLTEAGQGGIPVDLVAVARAAGVQRVIYQDLPSLDGVNRPTAGGREIAISKTTAKIRQRFTLAHEIAHMFCLGLSTERGPRERGPQLEPDEEEILCDQLAAEILMPRDAMQAFIREHGVGLTAIARASQLFEVSFEATASRVFSVSEGRLATVMWELHENGSLVASRSRVKSDGVMGSQFVPKGYRAPPGTTPVRALQSKPLVLVAESKESLQADGRGPQHYVESMLLRGSNRVLSLVNLDGWSLIGASSHNTEP